MTTQPNMSITQVASELREYAKKYNWNPANAEPPPPEMCREFEHEGLVFRVSFTRTLTPGLGIPCVYVLSISKRNAVPDASGAFLPTEEEGLEVAKAFFPEGDFAPIPGAVDFFKNSVKYYSPTIKGL